MVSLVRIEGVQSGMKHFLPINDKHLGPFIKEVTIES